MLTNSDNLSSEPVSRLFSNPGDIVQETRFVLSPLLGLSYPWICSLFRTALNCLEFFDLLGEFVLIFLDIFLENIHLKIGTAF